MSRLLTFFGAMVDRDDWYMGEDIASPCTVNMITLEI